MTPPHTPSDLSWVLWSVLTSLLVAGCCVQERRAAVKRQKLERRQQRSQQWEPSRAFTLVQGTGKDAA